MTRAAMRNAIVDFEIFVKPHFEIQHGFVQSRVEIEPFAAACKQHTMAEFAGQMVPKKTQGTILMFSNAECMDADNRSSR